MASRLLLFATPIAVLAMVLRVPLNTPPVPRAEVHLSAVDPVNITEAGDYLNVRLGQRDQRAARALHERVGADSPGLIPTSAATRPASDALFRNEQSPSAPANVSRDNGSASDVVPVGYLRPRDPSRSPSETAVAAAAFASKADSRPTTSLADHSDRLLQLRTLSQRYWRDPDSRSSFERTLFELGKSVYLDRRTHFVAPHVIQSGETLAEIAAQYAVTWEYLSDVNEVTPRRLQVGHLLKVAPGPFAAIVERSRHRLTIHAHGYVVAAFDVGLGEPGPDGETRTPLGRFVVSDRVTNPTWYGPSEVITGDDPSNPLGEYWLGLADQEGRPTSLGIHGTIAPHTIGRNTSNGCVRLRPDDIAQVFRLLSSGAVVEIRE